MKQTKKIKGRFVYLKTIIKIVTDKDYFWLPSSFSYYLVLSLIPTMYLVDFILRYLEIPTPIMEFLNVFDLQINEGALRGDTGSVIALLIALFLSFNVMANGVYAFLRINDSMYDILHINKKSQKIKRSKAYKITFILILLVILTSSIFILIEEQFKRHLNISLWEVLSIIPLMIMFLPLITFFFYLTPNTRYSLKKVLPGAIVASIGITITIYVFELLTKRYIDFTNIYGPLSYIVSLLVLCYFISLALTIGLAINSIKICHLLGSRSEQKRVK